MPKTSLKDIANAMGISRMTVSLALRNHPRIPESTKVRIREMAEKLGYRPDPEISKLMARLRERQVAMQPSTLALITTADQSQPWRFNKHFRKFYEGAKHRADELGYRLEEFWLREPSLRGERLAKILKARSIEGLLIGPLSRPSGHLSFDLSEFAAVEHGQNVWSPRLHRVDHNQFQGMLLAIRQLRRLGYRRIGFAVLEGYDRRVLHTWEGGFLFAQQRLPKSDRIQPLISPTMDPRDFVKWLDKTTPQVVIGSHLEIKDWIRQAGWSIPRDIGFVYLDWLEESDACAGINQHYEVIAAAAVDLVVEQVQANERGIADHPKLVLIDGTWVAGETVRRQ